jgi:DNA-binding response OmpR family regulator
MNTPHFGSPPSQEPGSASARQPLRILVADDDRDTVLTLTALLREEGHEVRGVHDGNAVLATLRDFHPDALILDIAMPGPNGFDLAKRLKIARGEATKPLLIAMSGIYKKGSDKILVKMVGFDHFLSKPCGIDAVLDALSPLSSAGR